MARRIAVFLIIVGLPGVLLAPAWRLAGLGAGEDDVLDYYPSRSFFHRSVQDGAFPMISPWTGLERPFLADPQSATFYPPTWLFAVLHPLDAYAAVLWLHYSLAIWGMYRLLRALRLSPLAAIFGGIVFAFSGFLLAHRVHFTMQNAAAWTPWAFWRLRRYALTPTRLPGGPQRLVAAAFVLAAQCFAGHVQVAALTALGTLVLLAAERFRPAFTVADGRSDRGENGPRPAPGGTGPIGGAAEPRTPVLTRWLIAWICAGGLFAVQWLPTLEYVRLCTRVERGYLDFTENSWAPPSAVGFVLPMLFGQRTPNRFDQPYWGPSHQCEQFGYVGFLPLVLALLALRGGWRAARRKRPWVLLGIVALVLALGLYGPLCPLLYLVPGSNLFRCPARAMLLIDLVLAVLAATTLHDLHARLTPARARLRAAVQNWTGRPLAAALLWVGVPVAAVALVLPFLPAAPRAAAWHALRPWNPAIWIPLLMIGASLAVLGVAARRWRQPGWLVVVAGLAAADLGVIGWTIDVPAGVRSPAELLTPRHGEWMDTVRDSGQRLWVVTLRVDGKPGEYIDPIEKCVANTNILRGIEVLTHYGALQPRRYVQRFGTQPWGESWWAAELLADTRWTRAANVGWILLCEGGWRAPDGCEHVLTTPDGYRLYRSPLAAGPAFFEHAQQPGVVRFHRDAPGRFRVTADTWPAAPAPNDPESWPRIVVSQLALPGWRAQVDGRPWQVEASDDVYLAARVPPGRVVTIEFAYSPPGLTAGALLSGCSLVILLAAGLGRSVLSPLRRVTVRRAG